MKDNTAEAEIVNEELKAPVLKDIKYPVNNTDIEALLKEYEEIPTIDPEADSEIVAKQFQFVLAGHKKFVKARTTIEKIRKELKAPSIEYGKKVDGIAKEFQAKINGVENALFIQRKIVEDNEARKQREAEEAEENRIDAIKTLMTELQALPLKHISSSADELQLAMLDMKLPTKETYEEFLDEAISLFETVSSQMKDTHETKVKAEQADKIIAEQEQKAKEEEAKRWDLQREQQAKIDKEREDFEREKKEFDDKQKAIQDDADAKLADKEADDLMKKQEADKLLKDDADKELYDKRYGEAREDLAREVGLTEFSALITAIQNGEIRHIKWSPDGN